MHQLVAAKKTDAEIQQDVLRELAWDTRVAATEVGVEVDEGVVTLTGTVDHWGKRHAAQEAAHRVHGVLDVANDITVRAPGTPGRTDNEIAHAVRHVLEWDVFVPSTRIQSTVSNGAVTLDGSVDNWSQRQDAERAVFDVRDGHVKVFGTLPTWAEKEAVIAAARGTPGPRRRGQALDRAVPGMT
jgi:osmotically-inducible protein OsmY